MSEPFSRAKVEWLRAEYLGGDATDDPRVVALCEDWIAKEEALEDLRRAARQTTDVLESTLYSPPGFTGPPVWWDNQARTAIKAVRAAAGAAASTSEEEG